MHNEQAANAERAHWLGVMSRSQVGELEALASALVSGIEFERLRTPHVGLVMVRGRAGGTGTVFNLGEMTVARASVRLPNGTVGHGYAQGRNQRQAEMAAVIDALLQQDDRRHDILTAVIEPLRKKAEARRLEKSRRAAATRVEFFTVARGEDPE
ncbi:phosphonate C-P lyase system protein PhnG [Microvirga sp. VF16]|uniref:phosphonate C-P lyase system protein PhnG n=1 Tax=Microvirga sp. VF16 TaxID=2807101 RepID=UPI00193E63D0|nr:phosphonate C-P lyase system protein PhnG [Microvirga sp. VF16]QRM32551.1 phosphonate C-P lyase system protein PhnG [Microvirga sp. VF16]